MIVVFFIYGLAFFSLGLAVAVHPKKHSHFALAKNAWLIAAFGILHGLNEWIDMFIIIHKPFDTMVLQVMRTLVLPLSFVCLLDFGIRSMMRIKGNHLPFRIAIPVLMLAWSIIVLTSSERFLMADIWARYLLALPGIALTFRVLILQESEVKKTGSKKGAWHLRLSAWAFLCYGFLAGLIVPEADFFPSSLLNYATISEAVGVPVQVFRSVCAVIIAYGMIRALAVFEWETAEELRKSRDTLEHTVQERTKDLIDTNARLENVLVKRMRIEKEREKLITELRHALDRVKQLSGLLPICSSCKKIRNDKGYWSQIEEYIKDHSEADFSHGICPECAKKLYPDLDMKKKG